MEESLQDAEQETLGDTAGNNSALRNSIVSLCHLIKKCTGAGFTNRRSSGTPTYRLKLD